MPHFGCQTVVDSLLPKNGGYGWF